MEGLKNFISAEELRDIMYDKNVFILDCRFDLFDPAVYGKKAYAEEHIEGAYYIDVDDDLSRDLKPHGGRRAIPDPEKLGAKLADLGIDMDSKIVCYDDGIAAACRARWQLVYMGYKDVKILDGGFKGWKKAGYPVTAGVPVPRGKGTFKADIHDDMYADKDYVLKIMDDPDITLVDCRGHKRYTGEVEPLYSKKGHIPTALNLSCDENVKDDIYVVDKETMKKNFEGVVGKKETVLYCGSGISAAINLACMDELGEKVRMYVGSMSDWITYDELEVEQGENK